MRCFPGTAAPCVCADGTSSIMPCDVSGFVGPCLCVGPANPQPPTADAGDDQSVTASERVVLDGTASSDPNGDALEYRWSLTTAPDGSDPILEGVDTATPSFTPGAVGTFVATLIVSDGQFDSEADTVTITAVNTPPVADAGTDQNVVTGSEATLDASASDDADGDTLTYFWRIVSKPEGSTAALGGANSSSPTLVPDVDGTYDVELVVSDGIEESVADLATIASYRRIDMLDFRILDAEYSDALDAIIAVSASPTNALHVYDAASGTAVSIALPLAPTSVSVGPSGLEAAVGHNAYVSLIDLSQGTVLATHAVTTDVLDVVLAGNGYAYAFPRVDQWEEIHSLELATGQESLGTGSIYAGTVAKLHPGGTALYGANNGLSPSDIERYDITGGTATMAYDSPYHGDYPMCGDLWLSKDGARIFTKCGHVFRASDVQAEDMTFNGSLDGVTRIIHLSHSAVAGAILLVPENDTFSSEGDLDRSVRIYGDDFLPFEREVGLPSFIIGGDAFAGHGRFVFPSADGTQFYVVLQADPASSLLVDYGIVTYEL